MLTAAQQERVERLAYLPEHLTAYVAAVAQAEPHLFGDYLAYAGPETLIFIGYPLEATDAPGGLEAGLAEALRCFRRRSVSLIAPEIPASLGKAPGPSDHYYRLDLRAVVRSAKTRNMLRRAAQEVTVQTGGPFGQEHRDLIASFAESRDLDEGTRFIFAGVERYLAAAPGARLFEARNSAGVLAAFAIADFTARDYGFYMFHFTAPRQRRPGVSDLLLDALIAGAVRAGKGCLNLGLGINAGVAAFKEKWGGVPFLPYASHRYRPGGRGFLSLLIEGLTR